MDLSNMSEVDQCIALTASKLHALMESHEVLVEVEKTDTGQFFIIMKAPKNNTEAGKGRYLEAAFKDLDIRRYLKNGAFPEEIAEALVDCVVNDGIVKAWNKNTRRFDLHEQEVDDAEIS
jgi:hypothetical protein